MATRTTTKRRARERTVRAYLHERGVAFDVFLHPRAISGIGEARSIGVEADEVLKTIVVDTAHGHVLLVLPASRKLDMSLVHEALGDHHAKLADEAEIAREYPGFELAAIPPLGSLLGRPVFVDASVFEHATVIFAAGIQTESLQVRTQDLFRDEGAHVAALTRAAPDDGDRSGPFG